jgi:hypothetical protein
LKQHDPRRLARFNTSNMDNVRDIAGFGIYSLVQETYVGFHTSKGFISVWNEPRKAKLAFSYHTNNTIAERANEYEIREIKTNTDMYGGKK